jgi:flagellar biosynthetic protein FliQ
MSAEAIMDLARSTIWVALSIGGPAMGIALVVGLVIGLFQALTSIQEMTLTFVPKIVAILLSLWVLGDYMATKLSDFFRGEVLDALSAI